MAVRPSNSQKLIVDKIIFLCYNSLTVKKGDKIMEIENILEFLGETRADKVKDHLMNTIMGDIADAIENNYNYITPIDALTRMMDEVYEESYKELRKKYKKQLKGAMEKEILKHLERYKGEKDANSN